MWVGTLENLQNCTVLTERVRGSALNFISVNDLRTLPNGRYELGDGNYVNIFEYDTKESDGIFEAHKEYIDIHYAIIGNEKVLWADDYTRETKGYQKDGDYSLGVVENANEIEPNYGCCVFLPDEPHKAGVIAQTSEKVKKAVFKIAVKKY